MPAKSSGSSSADGTEEDLARATQSERRRPENGVVAAERQAWQGSAWRPRVSGLGSIPAGETVGVRQGDDKVSFPC